MEILLGFLGVLIVLAFLSLPIVNLVMGISARKQIRGLKQSIQRLQNQLNSELKNRRFSSGAPDEKEEQHEPKPEQMEVSWQQKPKALTKPKEVEKPSVIETLKSPPQVPPPPIPPLIPPPDQTQVAEPVPTPAPPEPEPAEPSPEPAVKMVWEKPAKPEPVAASVQAESPLPAKADAESIEMKLGTYWFVRIGVVLVLTGLGTLAYYNKDFFFKLPPVAKVSLFYLLSAALGGVGFWLQRTRETLKNFGHVLVAGGCAGVYFTTYAAHVIQPDPVIPSPTVALLLLFAWGGFMVLVCGPNQVGDDGALCHRWFVLRNLHAPDPQRRGVAMGVPFFKPYPRGGGSGVHAAQPMAEDTGSQHGGILCRLLFLAYRN